MVNYCIQFDRLNRPFPSNTARDVRNWGQLILTDNWSEDERLLFAISSVRPNITTIAISTIFVRVGGEMRCFAHRLVIDDRDKKFISPPDIVVRMRRDLAHVHVVMC
jgi:hypothetical protein